MAFEPTQIRRYRAILKDLMSFKDDTEYAAGYEFTQEQLLTICPVDVKQ